MKETAKIAANEKIKVAELEEKNRQLQDEINRLKGEKSKPKIKPANTKDLNPPAKKPRKKKAKKTDLEIDETIEVDVDKSELPDDAKFVGTRDVVIQEIVLKRRNLKFVIKRYYSKELGKTFEGNVPEEFKGREFAPQLISFVLYQFYKNRVPHKKILDQLKDFGIEMSDGTLCSILNDLDEGFKDDLSSARSAAFNKCSQAHIDDSGARLSGINGYTFSVSNNYFTQFTTTFEKNRWAVVGRSFGGVQKFLIDQEAISYIAKTARRAKLINVFYKLEGMSFTRKEFDQKLDEIISFGVSKRQFDIVRTACAMSALRNNQLGPPVRFLISDDAPNFSGLIKNHQLCWVHEIRIYKKMIPYFGECSTIIDKVIDEWRKFYRLMKVFQNNPTQKLRKRIRSEFDRICSTKTMVAKINDQLDRTFNPNVA